MIPTHANDSSEPLNPDQLLPECTLHRTYAQVSSEIPGAPDSFELKGTPNLEMQLNIKTQKNQNLPTAYIVELTVTVKATVALPDAPQEEKKTLFLIEVKQNGIFTLEKLNETSLEKTLNIHCATMLYPYASALIADLAYRAGFTALHLPPIDFNKMNQQNQTPSE